jgi:CRP-like cAMP-binding protein
MAVLPLAEPARTPTPLGALLHSFAPLSETERRLICEGLGEAHSHAAGSEISAGAPRIVMDGWAAWARHLSDGRRQIVALLLPGDPLPGGPSRVLGMNHVALTPVRTVEARPLLEAMSRTPGETAGLALAWSRAHDAAQARLVAHITRLGRLSAHERMAHLMVELMDRKRRAGLARGMLMPLPITQEILADVLGLSIVHVNRTLRAMRREGVVETRGNHSVLIEEERLKAIADLS